MGELGLGRDVYPNEVSAPLHASWYKTVPTSLYGDPETRGKLTDIFAGDGQTCVVTGKKI